MNDLLDPKRIRQKIKDSTNNFHTLRKSYYKGYPNNIIFFDTETKEEIIDDDTKHLHFKLGWALHWNTIRNSKKEIFLSEKNTLWDYVDSLGDDEIILYAHNTEFDFKILDGYDYLIWKLGYTVENVYIEGKVFILNLVKGNKKINIYDTFNYCPVSLKVMGKSIGLDKQEIDFKECSDELLSEYCLNDVRITQLFLEKFINFLSVNNLGGLKPTISGCAFNSFRHRFYDYKNKPIFIHNHNLAIKLERESYKGGLCDCFKLGEYTETLYKLDVNSMYPAIMKKYKSPTKLIFYSRDHYKYDLEARFRRELNNSNHLVIARVRIKLNTKHAMILTRFKYDGEKKNGFLWGEFDTVLTEPELKYVQRYGKILTVYELSVYEQEDINSDYIDFFYNERLKAIDKDDDANNMIAKLFLNSYYGKYGQLGSSYELITDEANTCEFQRLNVIKDGEKFIALQFGNRVYKIYRNEENAYNSFVAIASFITAYARMEMIKYINVAGRDNCFYMDTDCVIVNKKGYKRLNKFIDDSDKKVLGMLELEGISEFSKFFKPKYYVFNDVMKCKGVRKKFDLLYEDDNVMKVKQEQFQKFKMAFNEGTYNVQKIRMQQKDMSKKYNKGMVLDGVVYPFCSDQVDISDFDIMNLN